MGDIIFGNDTHLLHVLPDVGSRCLGLHISHKNLPKQLLDHRDLHFAIELDPGKMSKDAMQAERVDIFLPKMDGNHFHWLKIGKGL